MSNGIKVKKRDGRLEPINLDKIHLMVECACDGLSGVSASQVEMQSGIQFYNGISTEDIQKILIKSASDLITLENVNYQFVAARLLLFGLYKDVFGSQWKLGMPTIENQYRRGCSLGIYDKALLDKYSPEEWTKLNNHIDHHRDYLFTYAGLRQAVDKYLVQNRVTGEIYESPQYAYMYIAMTIFSNYPRETRLHYVKSYYDASSKQKINLPTPINAGVRTPLRQYASCVLVDVNDDLKSIFHSNSAIGFYVAQRAGIGINGGRIRSIGSLIRGGEVVHSGLIPFLRMYESTVRSCTQNGIRGGSATVHFPIWHKEIQDILVLKNNKGTQDNRVRKLDYSIQLSKLFYERFIKAEKISLFCPSDVPGLYDAFGSPEFDDLYLAAERDTTIPRLVVDAQELIKKLLQERAETGRIYIMNIDHANSHSSFLDPIYMSNLCQEITLPTVPIKHIDDTHGEIALCILSAFNLGKINNVQEMEHLADLMVRALDALIDYQEYPVEAARIATTWRRSLGIGFIGLAHYLAKNGVGYEDPTALKLVHEISEAAQYYLLRASNNLAKEYGPCEYFDRTKYSKGILPIDTYKKDVDDLIPNELNFDWESLRQDILKYGLRNSTLTAQMPSESSSVISNETNGIEPPRDYLSIKKSKKGVLKQIVPQYNSLKNNYTLLWDMKSNAGYLNIVAVMQKFFDQGISANWSYNPEHYPDRKVPMSVLIQDLLVSYKLGLKTVYYNNTYDSKVDSDVSIEQPIMTDEEIQEILNGDETCDSCAI